MTEIVKQLQQINDALMVISLTLLAMLFFKNMSGK